jgi:hypothetical protein
MITKLLEVVRLLGTTDVPYIAVMRWGLVLLCLAGCGPDFHAETAKTYEPIVKVASRVPHRPRGACVVELGTIHVHGSADDNIDAIAHKAADVGGNTYFIRENVGGARYVGTAYSTGWGYRSEMHEVRDVDTIAEVYRDTCGDSGSNDD